MKTMQTGMKAIGPALAVLCMAGAAQAVEDTDLALGESYAGTAPGGGAPWVNVLLRDFSDAAPGAYGDFESEAPLEPVIIEKVEILEPATVGEPAAP